MSPVQKLTWEQAKLRVARVPWFEERLRFLDIEAEPRAVSSSATLAPVQKPDLRGNPPERPQTRDEAISLWGSGSEAFREWERFQVAVAEAAYYEAQRFVERNRARIERPTKRNRDAAKRSSKNGKFDRRIPVEVTNQESDEPEYLYLRSRDMRGSMGWLQVEIIDDPDCPSCGGWMSRRLNRQTGEGFWGCTSWPQCTGTRPLMSYKPIGHVLPR